MHYRGGLIKLGQVASLRIDVIPEGMTAELAKLQDRVAPHSFDEIAFQIEHELGRPISEVFLRFDEEPAPLFPPRIDYLPWLLGGLGVVLLAAVLVWWWRRPRKYAPPTQVPLQPHVKALRALARLRQAPRQTEEQVEAFYVSVSHVLRVYLEERFGLHAPERTTEEFLLELEQGYTLDSGQRLSLRRFLQQCDLVKFARLIPTSEVHDQTFGVAEEFVEQTRPDRIREPDRTREEGAA